MSFWTILLFIMLAFPAFIVGILFSLFLLWAVLLLAELASTKLTKKEGKTQ